MLPGRSRTDNWGDIDNCCKEAPMVDIMLLLENTKKRK